MSFDSQFAEYSIDTGYMYMYDHSARRTHTHRAHPPQRKRVDHAREALCLGRFFKNAVLFEGFFLRGACAFALSSVLWSCSELFS